MREDPEHGSTLDLVQALQDSLALGASDLHLKVGNRPLVRVHGELKPLYPEARRLAGRDTEDALHNLLTVDRIAEFERKKEIDFGYSAPGLGRFRVNAYRQRGTVAIVMRSVSGAVHTIDSLGLPDVVRRLAEEERGIVLVTGTTGSGKSSTVAAMIEHINATMCKHVVTIEDPIEYLFRDAMASIDQREIGMDTDSFGTALRQSLRQDPDVIFVGEMRDAETVRTALTAAETGHLVLSTLHTADATESINRIMDFFDGREQAKVRAMLAGSLAGIISQRLVPGVGEGKRVAVTEILTMTGRVHDAILGSKTGEELQQIMSEGEFYGMHSFDQALYAAIDRGEVAVDIALHHATHPHDLKLLIALDGHYGTTMEDLHRGTEEVDQRPPEDQGAQTETVAPPPRPPQPSVAPPT
jgi:twitching motility protein PilT